ncbi:MAG: VTT domain-containing protein [Pseudomonadota bacterium]
MVELLRRLGEFLTSMDAKAATSLAVSIVLLIFVILMFVFGQAWLGRAVDLNSDAGLATLMERAYASPWAVAVVISIYVLLALTGFPQILLITATVLTFGPRNGAVYAWMATMTSATVTFALGRLWGSQWVSRFGGQRVRKTIDFIGRHGVLASALVRVVPSAPFIVVNSAAGAAHIPIWKFWAGTAIGIIPKIALVASIGAIAPDRSVLKEGASGLVEFFTSREPGDLALIVLIIAVWLGFLLLMRRFYLRLRRRDGPV